MLLEADLLHGVWVVPLSLYEQCHTRICRPVGLGESDREAIISAGLGCVGHQYDLKNVIDLVRYLVRYLVPTPPVPVRWRRRMIALGSGQPTARDLLHAYCPVVSISELSHPATRRAPPAPRPGCDDCVDEILHIRHHSLFAPRDFDISPYFRVVKPTVEAEFDFHTLVWQRDEAGADLGCVA